MVSGFFFGHLSNLSDEQIQEAAKKRVAVYENDLNYLLCVEIICFIEFIKSSSRSAAISNEHFMCKTMIGKNVKSTFPNVEVALRIYLVIMVVNSSD